MSETAEFDVNQGHGDHNGCLFDPGKKKEALATWLSRTVQEGELLATRKDPIPCVLDEGPTTSSVAYIGRAEDGIRYNALITLQPEQNKLFSFYPEFDGTETDVRLTAIHEWAAGLEATLEGTVLGDEREIAFFDTRYALHKGQYEIGKTYRFRLSAFAYHAEVLPEKEREFRLEGEDAVRHRERLGEPPETEEDGTPKPVIFHMEKMVALFLGEPAYPDDMSFQSPLFAPPRHLRAYDADFLQLQIAIARAEEDLVIPLIAKKSFFPAAPEQDDPIRGLLWLQGCRADTPTAPPPAS